MSKINIAWSIRCLQKQLSGVWWETNRVTLWDFCSSGTWAKDSVSNLDLIFNHFFVAETSNTGSNVSNTDEKRAETPESLTVFNEFPVFFTGFFKFYVDVVVCYSINSINVLFWTSGFTRRKHEHVRVQWVWNRLCSVWVDRIRFCHKEL